MKKELIKFIEKETGFVNHQIIDAVKKYFKGMETQWQNKYIHETQSMSCDNGELYLYGEFGTIVWNCETLFSDLPYIIKMVYKERQAVDQRVKEQIEEITRLVTQ
jgi:hypothetical protein